MTDINELPRQHVRTLLAVMRALRDPQTGCPWDIQQTSRTIAPYTIEEAYEVADAISENDQQALCDELGDLLLQVVYHAQIASEAGAFDFGDVVATITEKMIRRHPHVFGSTSERSKRPEAGFWENIKAKERANESAQETFFDDVPSALPALSRAVKLQCKAAHVNFDWPSSDQVLDKIVEELHELREVDESGDAEKQTEEFGDLLFAIANYARHKKIDPEEALRRTNRKFINRFNYVLQGFNKKHKSLNDASLDEMEQLWEQAKKLGIK